MELAAIFAVSPARFENDSQGRKEKWRASVEENLKSMVNQLNVGKLTVVQQRCALYTKFSPSDVGPIEDRESVFKFEVTSGKAALDGERDVLGDFGKTHKETRRSSFELVLNHEKVEGNTTDSNDCATGATAAAIDSCPTEGSRPVFLEETCSRLTFVSTSTVSDAGPAGIAVTNDSHREHTYQQRAVGRLVKSSLTEELELRISLRRPNPPQATKPLVSAQEGHESEGKSTDLSVRKSPIPNLQNMLLSVSLKKLNKQEKK